MGPRAPKAETENPKHGLLQSTVFDECDGPFQLFQENRRPSTPQRDEIVKDEEEKLAPLPDVPPTAPCEKDFALEEEQPILFGLTALPKHEEFNQGVFEDTLKTLSKDVETFISKYDGSCQIFVFLMALLGHEHLSIKSLFNYFKSLKDNLSCSSIDIHESLDYICKIAKAGHSLPLLNPEELGKLSQNIFPESPLSEEDQKKLINKERKIDDLIFNGLLQSIPCNNYYQLTFIEDVDVAEGDEFSLQIKAHAALIFKTTHEDKAINYHFFDPNLGFFTTKNVDTLCEIINKRIVKRNSIFVGISDIVKILKRSKNYHALIHEINQSLQRTAFIKIYQALRHGQSGVNVLKTNFLSGKGPMSDAKFIQAIKDRTRERPEGRTATAWELSKIHYKNVSDKNIDLFTGIYKWSFSSSGLFFKRAKITGKTFYKSSSLNKYLAKNQLTKEAIEGAQKDTRSYNISSCLR